MFTIEKMRCGSCIETNHACRHHPPVPEKICARCLGAWVRGYLFNVFVYFLGGMMVEKKVHV